MKSVKLKSRGEDAVYGVLNLTENQCSSRNVSQVCCSIFFINHDTRLDIVRIKFYSSRTTNKMKLFENNE